jgi:hypothetical protein
MSRIFWRSAVRTGLFLVAVLICCLPGVAQQTLGSLNGTVVDPSGAAVAGATVIATNVAINVTAATTTMPGGHPQREEIARAAFSA